jgi:hypothetical protein
MWTTVEPEEEEKIHGEAHERKKMRTKSTLCTIPPDTPVIDISHTADAPESYDKHGIAYRQDVDKGIDKIAYIPRKLVVERHHAFQYRVADKGEDENGNKSIWYKSPTLRSILRVDIPFTQAS